MQEVLEQRNVNSEELVRLLKARDNGNIDFLLVDVREDLEYNERHISGVDMLKPTTSFQDWSASLLKDSIDKSVIFTCRTGSRSRQVQNAFAHAGHKNVINHSGGIMTYRGETTR